MTTAKPHRVTIMVVEDEAALSSMACEMVEECKLEPFACDPGDVAYGYLKTHADQIAALFVDIGVRDTIDGFALAITTNADCPRIRICVTSGQTKTRPAGLLASVKLVPKPWRALEVLDFVLPD
ncbi:hypothetical protein D3273_26430 [Lichenibacterium minor]|uniref:Response regulator n=1 Tax=Lichenibacterium minor TaxID=2316528 RepID=A0A4Q2TXY6_9HYPH|nr:hypothetical protein [Lichenibacterium minor]RYC28962.1 hypothetical protein D3273_26430 [Lichenibacterium minor]